MHEWALAESVIKTAENKKEFRDKKIIIYLGELQNIDMEIFRFAMDELIKQRNIKLNYKFEIQKAEFKCNKCGEDFDIEEVKDKSDDEKENIHFIPEMVKAFIKCPKCKSVDFEIVKGRGVGVGIE